MRTFSVDWPAPQWLDLFYDLAFAAGVLAISSSYGRDYSVGGAVWFAVAYGVLACTWLLTSSALGAFAPGQRRITSVIVALVLVQMTVVLLLAVVAGDTLSETTDLFDTLMALALLISLVLAIRARRVGVRQSLVWPVTVGLAIVAMAATWLVPGSWSVWVWLVALGLAAIAVVFAVADSAIDVHRLAHRLGELTLIIIGEFLVKVALTAAEESVLNVRLLALVPVLIFLATAWWAYFTGPVRASHLTGPQRLGYVAGHLPLHLGLLGLAVGLGKLAVAAATTHKEEYLPNLLAGPLLLIVAGLALIELAVEPRRARLLGLAAVVVAVAASILWALDADPTVAAYALALTWLGFTVVQKRLEPTPKSDAVAAEASESP